ncbi:MAG: DNA recombination protein RmuC [Propionibacterium sp.]|nr:DNA recombination protein RmuC [Propionibacterium sp.]
MEILIALAALVIGALAGYFVARRFAAAADDAILSDARLDASNARADASRAREEAATARTDAAKHDAELARLSAAASDAQAAAADARAAVATAEAKVASLTAERDHALARSKEIAADRESLQNQFKLLSAESLEKQGKAASEQLISPVSEGLKLLQERITAVEKERAQMSAEMKEQISSMRLSGESLRKETLSLANALRTPQVRGSWGEQSLRRMVEISGLTARVDFDEQVSGTGSDGERQRPDMRIRLAGHKVVFVDSKVPLAAVLDAYNTEDAAEQEKHLGRFARHVRTHIDDLAGKNYWALDAGSPEFVVLFLGSDEFYRLAQEQMPDLHEYAARKNVMLASPGILIPMLHIVAHGWTQASLAESAARVVKLGKELHERLATMGGHFEKMGRSLTGAVKAYNAGVSSLERRVMVSARRFAELEVTKDELAEIETLEVSPNTPAVPEMLEHQQHELEWKEESALLDEPADDVAFDTPRAIRAKTGTMDE